MDGISVNGDKEKNIPNEKRTGNNGERKQDTREFVEYPDHVKNLQKAKQEVLFSYRLGMDSNAKWKED